MTNQFPDATTPKSISFWPEGGCSVVSRKLDLTQLQFLTRSQLGVRLAQARASIRAEKSKKKTKQKYASSQARGPLFSDEWR
jgi:hypothetical protein